MSFPKIVPSFTSFSSIEGMLQNPNLTEGERLAYWCRAITASLDYYDSERLVYDINQTIQCRTETRRIMAERESEIAQIVREASERLRKQQVEEENLASVQELLPQFLRKKKKPLYGIDIL